MWTFYIVHKVIYETTYDTGDRDIIMELGRALMDAGIKLGRGLAVIVEVLLKVSMLKPAQEETIPQCTRPRVTFILFHLF